MRVSYLVAAVCLLGPLTARESAAASRSLDASALLLSTDVPIEQQVEAAEGRRVIRRLTNLQVGPVGREVTPQELQGWRGSIPPDSPENATLQHEEVEIAAQVPPGVPERALQARIPFGIAGLVWGFCHPREAWRLVLPVLT